MTATSYHNAIDEVVAIMQPLAESIAAVYLGGSVARGDFVPGRSDIDLYVVLRDRNPQFEQSLRANAQQIAEQWLRAVLPYNVEPLSITFTSLEEIDNGRSFLGTGFEYEGFVAHHRLLLGEDIIERIPQTDHDRSWDIAQFALNMLQALVQAQDSSAATPEIAGFLFSPVFRAAAIGMGIQGRFVGGKHETIEAFRETLPDETELIVLLERSYALWEIWAIRDLTQPEVSELAAICQQFVGGAYRMWCN